MHTHLRQLNGSSAFFVQFKPAYLRPSGQPRNTEKLKHHKPLQVSCGLFDSYQKFKASKDQSTEPFEAKVVSSVLSASNTPYSSYVPAPRGVLHDVHATIKQLWLVVLLVITARSQSPAAIAGGIALLSILALPPRLWKAQLKRLGLLALFMFVTTAVFADGIPPATQVRTLAPKLEGLPAIPPTESSYRYVLFHFLFFTVTRRSLQLAITTSCLTFTALQSASLCLTTTPAEELALGVRTWLAPFQLIGAPVAELSLTLLLSLRFLAVVFEEVRNLALGLAARNIQWRALGSGAGLQVSLKLLGRLFSNLMSHSENVAIAMKARGFVGPAEHQVVMSSQQQNKFLPNVLAILLLGGLLTSGYS